MNPISTRPFIYYRNGSYYAREPITGTSTKPKSFQDSLETTSCAAELAGKYDPHHMSQEQYGAFLDDLERKGILSNDDKMLLKNPNMRFGENFDREEFERTGISGGGFYIVEDRVSARLRTLEEEDGDVSRWIKALIAYETQQMGRGAIATEDHQRMAALRTMADVLRQMDK